MTETGIIGRVIDVRSTTIRVALDVGSKGFTKVGPDGIQTVGVVNSYITVPAGAHREARPARKAVRAPLTPSPLAGEGWGEGSRDIRR